MKAPDVIGMPIDEGRRLIFETSKDFAFIVHECHSFKDEKVLPLSMARILKQTQKNHEVHLFVGFIDSQTD